MRGQAKSGFTVLFFESAAVVVADLTHVLSLDEAIQEMGDGMQRSSYICAEVVCVSGLGYGRVMSAVTSLSVALNLARSGTRLVGPDDRIDLLALIEKGEGRLGHSRFQYKEPYAPRNVHAAESQPADRVPSL